ncbi:hypothetical protein J1N35_019651 [Gossypium stocksii]|uniref:Uncharacterized protein n=1 Tax=Gossypium stocksii TaxID=47602 RepID=A0A9D4A7B3_9ROSI|nr:hypothetical protein J1N35_019651 [Gossypium stocksii]
MAAQDAWFEQQLTFQQELLKQNDELRKKVKSLGSLPKPFPVRHSTRKLNSKDKCDFHNDVGHKTEDYFTLKDVIEEAV